MAIVLIAVQNFKLALNWNRSPFGRFVDFEFVPPDARVAWASSAARFCVSRNHQLDPICRDSETSLKESVQ